MEFTPIVKEVEESKIPCPLCSPDGVMEGKLINDITYMWICTACPGILFEFHNMENAEDIVTYLQWGGKIK